MTLDGGSLCSIQSFSIKNRQTFFRSRQRMNITKFSCDVIFRYYLSTFLEVLDVEICKYYPSLMVKL